jgi:(p)ppGpp synthase/HD superfamily hydrolase
MSLAVKAYKFAREKHSNQKDDIGKSYFEAHVAQVGNLISFVTEDEDIIAAAFLHDTLEDTNTTFEELEKEFGNRVANLVYEITHDGKKDNKGYYFPRLKTRDAILIKFADRLSNLSRMESWPPDRQQQYLKKSKFWKESV